jgi:hypothetical protein
MIISAAAAAAATPRAPTRTPLPRPPGELIAPAAPPITHPTGCGLD